MLTKTTLFTLFSITAFAVKSPSLPQAVEGLMSKWHIPGGSVAIAREGKVIYAKGFGDAKSDSVFRVASLSKPFTAVAVLQLVEAGRLTLETPVFSVLDRELVPGDERMRRITIRHLLQHSGGWDYEVSGDPVGPVYEDLQALGAPIPVSQREVIRHWLTKRLDFDPGTRYAYSNFGYVLLGRVIEHVTGEPYEHWVANHVLARAGIGVRRIGGNLLADAVRGEVRYADYPGAPLVRSILSSRGELAPAPYGSFDLKLLDSCGGWLSTAAGYARFLEAVTNGKLLRVRTLEQIAARPSYVPADSEGWTGLGFGIVETPVGPLFTHTGMLRGTTSAFLHLPGVLTVVGMFDSAPEKYDEFLAEVIEVLSSSAPGVANETEEASPARPEVEEVVNAATGKPGPIAPGELVAIRGRNLGPEVAVAARYLTTAEAGVRVTVNGIEAAVLYVSAGDVRAVVPNGVAVGSAEVVVEYLGAASPGVALPVAVASPGIFGAEGGEGVLTLWVTGVSLADLTVEANGQALEILYAGLAPSSWAGVWQVNAKAALGRPMLTVRSAGVVSPAVEVSIR